MNKRLVISCVAIFLLLVVGAVLTLHKAETTGTREGAQLPSETDAAGRGGGPAATGAGHEATSGNGQDARSTGTAVSDRRSHLTVGTEPGRQRSSPGSAPMPGVERALSQMTEGGTGNEPAWHPGEEAVAAVTRADGQTIGGLRLNQVNNFPQVNIEPEETVRVTVDWPQGAPGEKVVAAVEDGGQLEDGQRVVLLQLNAQRTAAFRFTASAEPGVFRITLRKGADTKIVELWAGPELAQANAEQR